MSKSTVSPLVRELDISVVERDINAYLAQHPNIPTSAQPISLASIYTPSSSIAANALKHARSHLDDVMFNHSNRVYYIGMAMAQQHFPEWRMDNECYYLTSLFHDLGVGHNRLTSTRLSFEFDGAIQARDFILGQAQLDPSYSQTDRNPLQNVADEVCEAIIRHTNFVKGKMTTTAELIQLSTTLDVIGANTRHISATTYNDIVKTYPRLDFHEHFAALMEAEMHLKPWSHTTSVEEENGFCAKIRGNKLFG
jgi:cyanamide hydratase